MEGWMKEMKNRSQIVTDTGKCWTDHGRDISQLFPFHLAPGKFQQGLFPKDFPIILGCHSQHTWPCSSLSQSKFHLDGFWMWTPQAPPLAKPGSGSSSGLAFPPLLEGGAAAHWRELGKPTWSFHSGTGSSVTSSQTKKTTQFPESSIVLCFNRCDNQSGQR